MTRLNRQSRAGWVERVVGLALSRESFLGSEEHRRRYLACASSGAHHRASASFARGGCCRGQFLSRPTSFSLRWEEPSSG